MRRCCIQNATLVYQSISPLVHNAPLAFALKCISVVLHTHSDSEFVLDIYAMGAGKFIGLNK
jgi:hypothetical protein